MAIDFQDLVLLWKKRPVVIGCGALTLMLLAGSYLRSSRMGELGGLLKSKEEEGQKILNNIRNGAGLAEQYEALTATTKDLESRLVRSSERARNQQYFYRIESDTGVKEVNLQPVPAPNSSQQKGPKTLYIGVGYTISVKGSFRQILDFLGRLEAGQHFFRLTSATVSREGQRAAADATNAITLTLNLDLLGLP